MGQKRLLSEMEPQALTSGIACRCQYSYSQVLISDTYWKALRPIGINRYQYELLPVGDSRYWYCLNLKPHCEPEMRNQDYFFYRTSNVWSVYLLEINKLIIWGLLFWVKIL